MEFGTVFATQIHCRSIKYPSAQTDAYSTCICEKDRRTHEEIDRGARDLDAAVPVPVPAFGSKSNYYDVH